MPVKERKAHMIGLDVGLCEYLMMMPFEIQDKKAQLRIVTVKTTGSPYDRSISSLILLLLLTDTFKSISSLEDLSCVSVALAARGLKKK